MLRGAGQERQSFSHHGAWPNGAARRPAGRLRTPALQLPSGDMAAAVGLGVAGILVAILAIWQLGGFPPLFGEEPLAPALSRQELLTPSGCTVLELDRKTNRTTPQACPSHI